MLQSFCCGDDDDYDDDNDWISFPIQVYKKVEEEFLFVYKIKWKKKKNPK